MIDGRNAADDLGLADLISQVREDGVRYAKAEIAFHRERLTLRVGEFKQVAIFGVAAALIALSALITLLVGLVMTLTPRVGPFWATLIVVGASLLLAFLLVKVAQRHIGRIGGAA